MVLGPLRCEDSTEVGGHGPKWTLKILIGKRNNDLILEMDVPSKCRVHQVSSPQKKKRKGKLPEMFKRYVRVAPLLLI